jgi:hypothetical protein
VVLGNGEFAANAFYVWNVSRFSTGRACSGENASAG